jgi:uncharacterized membrane protein
VTLPTEPRPDVLGLPSPEILERFEKVSPGTVSFIQNEMKAHREAQENAERRSHEARMYRNQTERLIATRGQFFGLAIGVIAIVAGTIAALYQAQVAGSFIGAGGVFGLVSVFVVQSRPSSNSSGHPGA